MTMARNSICPMIVTKGNDQLPMSSKYDARSTPGVIRNYGNLLVELCKVVPDGIVCFFTGYAWMEEVVMAWAEVRFVWKEASSVWRTEVVMSSLLAS